MAHTSVGGSKTTQNSQTGVDNTTAGRMGAIWNAGAQAGQAGPGPLLNGSAGYNSGLMGAGSTASSALGGDQNAASKLMSPYQQQVVDANNAQWQRTNQQTLNAVDDRATAAGAFGGSRSGVAEGTAMAQNNLAQQQQNASLLNGGYEDTMNRAANTAALGQGASNANSQLGFAGVGSPSMWNMNMLKQGYMGPTGSTSSGATSNVNASAGFKLF